MFSQILVFDPETPAVEPIYMSGGVCDVKGYNNTFETRSAATAPTPFNVQPDRGTVCTVTPLCTPSCI